MPADRCVTCGHHRLDHYADIGCRTPLGCSCSTFERAWDSDEGPARAEDTQQAIQTLRHLLAIAEVEALSGHPLENDPVNHAIKTAIGAMERLADYENAINWGVDCTSCAKLLDASIADHERAEQAQQRLDALQQAARGILETDGSYGQMVQAEIRLREVLGGGP